MYRSVSGRAALMHACAGRRPGFILCWAILLSVTGLLSVSGLLSVTGTVFGQEEDSPTTTEDQPPVIRSQPVATGFVLVDGKCLSAPYILEQDGKEVRINGQVVFRIPAEGSVAGTDEPGPEPGSLGPGWGGGGPAWGGGPGWGGSGPRGVFGARRRSVPFGGRRPSALVMVRMERELRNNSMVLAFDAGNVSYLPPVLAAEMFNTLLSDMSTDSKVSFFAERQAYATVSNDHWQRMIAKFPPGTELDERITQLLDQQRDVFEADRLALTGAQWYGVLSSPTAKYGITLAAMMLAVVALGNLLLNRPQRHGRWSDIHDVDVEIDVRLIVLLLALLGGFDLLLTLAAQQAGGFLEMNPLGSQLVGSPVLLTAFKMTGLLLACGILLRLRRYHGAQVACWWMCMLCTVLTFRWVTFNSLFVS